MSERLKQARPGSTLRLEIDPGAYLALTMRLGTEDHGELFAMLMAEAQEQCVPAASKPCVKEAFDSRDDYRLIKGGFGRSRLSVATRYLVYLRDGRTCGYCGRAITWAEYHCDHVEPASRGGSDHPDNLKASCAACNLAKAAKPLEEWLG